MNLSFRLKIMAFSQFFLVAAESVTAKTTYTESITKAVSFRYSYGLEGEPELVQRDPSTDNRKLFDHSKESETKDQPMCK